MLRMYMALLTMFSKAFDFNYTFSSQLLLQYNVVIAKYISWRNTWRMWNSWNTNMGPFSYYSCCINICFKITLKKKKKVEGRSPRRETETASVFHISNNMNSISFFPPHAVCSSFSRHPVYTHFVCCLILSVGALCWQQTRKPEDRKAIHSL